MKRKIIKIDEEKCNGCGLCVPNCPEGAIQIVEGKARLVRESLCDGLGACLGECPEGAITIEEREAAGFDERQVMENIIREGKEVIEAHLEHLREHREYENLRIAHSILKERGMEIPNQTEKTTVSDKHQTHASTGCPGARSMSFSQGIPSRENGEEASAAVASRLTHWPIQLHLIFPGAPQYYKKDVLLAADCVAFSLGDFHRKYLSGRSLAIACPKLDEGQEIYQEKIKSLIDEAQINTLTVMTMQVPCCTGLLYLAKEAAQAASRKVPIKHIVVGLRGDILSEEWV